MYRKLREEVEDCLREALAARGLPTADLGIEDPPADVEAVLASSVAFRLAGEIGDAPTAIAEDLARHIDTAQARYVGDIAAAGPYLNVTPSAEYFRDTLSASLDPGFGELPSTGEEIVVEHTSANPTGPVHVGRARNPIIGDAIARILEFAGHTVDRHYYVNDAGRQVAVFTWAYETLEEADLPPPARDKPDYDLVRYYRKGNEVLEEGDPDIVAAAEQEIEAIMAGLEAGDEDTYERVARVVDRVLEGMRQTLDRLPATFDEFIPETRFMRDGSTDAVIDRLTESPSAEQSDGAWQLDLSEFGVDKELVFVRSDGTSLYPTRDIAHHMWKLEHYDRAVTVLGEDHELQAQQVSGALSILGCDVDRIEQVLHSYVNLPEGRMSTRAGTGVDMDDLLDEAEERARQEVEDRLESRIRNDELTDGDIDRIARQVGIGAVRFDIVSKQTTKAITFEWERALDFEAQSAPYLQYVHARCCGIIAQADSSPPEDHPGATLDHPAERALLEVIARFPAVVEDAGDTLEPHTIATYCRTFAETFNAFYRDCPVTADDVPPDRQAARLALVVGARHTIGNALYLLGIEAPESM